MIRNILATLILSLLCSVASAQFWSLPSPFGYLPTCPPAIWTFNHNGQAFVEPVGSVFNTPHNTLPSIPGNNVLMVGRQLPFWDSSEHLLNQWAYALTPAGQSFITHPHAPGSPNSSPVAVARVGSTVVWVTYSFYPSPAIPGITTGYSPMFTFNLSDPVPSPVALPGSFPLTQMWVNPNGLISAFNTHEVLGVNHGLTQINCLSSSAFPYPVAPLYPTLDLKIFQMNVPNDYAFLGFGFTGQWVRYYNGVTYASDAVRINIGV